MKKLGENILWAARFVCTLGVVIFGLLELLQIWDKAVNVAVPLLGFGLVIQAAQEWKTRKKSSIVCLVTALVIFTVSLVVWFIK